ncbi:STM0539 family protein, partial [Salmonella enterica subsp. enterica serovar Anatum]|nr:STM0539 family protein [Salmonella enterica subsp. enterica serovar Anatum]
DIKMQVPLHVVKEGNLKAGDKVTLEKTQEGTGAYLKKEGKILVPKNSAPSGREINPTPKLAKEDNVAVNGLAPGKKSGPNTSALA